MLIVRSFGIKCLAMKITQNSTNIGVSSTCQRTKHDRPDPSLSRIPAGNANSIPRSLVYTGSAVGVERTWVTSQSDVVPTLILLPRLHNEKQKICRGEGDWIYSVRPTKVPI